MYSNILYIIYIYIYIYIILIYIYIYIYPEGADQPCKRLLLDRWIGTRWLCSEGPDGPTKSSTTCPKEGASRHENNETQWKNQWTRMYCISIYIYIYIYIFVISLSLILSPPASLLPFLVPNKAFHSLFPSSPSSSFSSQPLQWSCAKQTCWSKGYVDTIEGRTTIAYNIERITHIDARGIIIL